MKKTVSVLLITALCVCLFASLTVPAFAEQHLDGTVGVTYSNMYEENLGFTATSIVLDEGTAPAGITVNVSGSRLYVSGTPTATGTYYVNYRVYSDSENYCIKYFSFTISAPTISVSGLASGTNVTLTGYTNSGSVMFFYRNGSCMNPGSPATVSGGTASFTDSGLTPGTSYTYKAAVNISGTVYYSSDVVITVPAAANPQAVLSAADSKLSLNVSGIDVSSGYTVYFVANTQNTTSGGIQLNNTAITVNTSTYTYEPDFSVLPGQSYYFYALVKSGSYNFKSNAVQLSKTGEATVEITKSPTDETVDEGDSAMFISAATNYTKYEWRVVTADGATCWRNKDEIEGKFAGVSFESYQDETGREVLVLSNIPASMDGYYIETKFWGKTDSDIKFTDSKAAKLTVKTTGPQVPVFSSQPQDVTAESGSSVSLNAAATAAQGTVKYQWYMNTVKSTSGAAKIDSATSSSFTPPQNTGTYYYFCAVWTEKGTETSSVVYSDIAQVTFTQPAAEQSPEITVTPEPTAVPDSESEDEAGNEENEKKKDTDDETSPVVFGIIALLGAVFAGGIAALVAKRSNSAKSAAAATVASEQEPNIEIKDTEVTPNRTTVKYCCEYCGWEPTDPNNPPKFCPNCGKPFSIEE